MKKKHIYRKKLAKVLKKSFKELDNNSLKPMTLDQVLEHLNKITLFSDYD